MESIKVQYIPDETQLEEIFNKLKQEITMNESVLNKLPIEAQA